MLLDRRPALVAIERRGVPGDVPTALANGLHDPRLGDDPGAHRVVAVLVNQDERAGHTIGGVGIGEYDRARAKGNPADVIEPQPGGFQLALERLGIGSFMDRLNGSPDSPGGVLERVSPTRMQGLLAHPADRALQFPGGRWAILGPDQHVASTDVQLIRQRHGHGHRRDRILHLRIKRVQRGDGGRGASGEHHDLIADR